MQFKIRSMNDYWVYVLKSKQDSRLYVGISQDPSRRLRSHNRGETRSTKGYRPWVLVYTKMIGSRAEARKEEIRLKSGYGKEWLKQYINK